MMQNFAVQEFGLSWAEFVTAAATLGLFFATVALVFVTVVLAWAAIKGGSIALEQLKSLSRRASQWFAGISHSCRLDMLTRTL